MHNLCVRKYVLAYMCTIYVYCLLRINIRNCISIFVASPRRVLPPHHGSSILRPDGADFPGCVRTEARRCRSQMSEGDGTRREGAVSWPASLPRCRSRREAYWIGFYEREEPVDSLDGEGDRLYCRPDGFLLSPGFFQLVPRACVRL